MDSIPSIQKLILGYPKKIAIIMHTNPDGDALGSSLGLAAFLKKHNHNITVIAPNEYPDFLNWLPGISDIIIYDKSNKILCSNILSQADIIFCVDFAMLSRINELQEIVRHAKATKIIIDHHLDKEDFADIMLWDPQAASSAELVYQLIESLGQSSYIDKDIAECLYVGITTDTQSFKTTNTTSHVHYVAAKLIEHQVDVQKINKLVYGSNSIHKLKFISFIISKRLIVLPDYNAAYIIIKSSDAKTFNLNMGDTEGLVNYALSIKDISLAALIKEKQDKIHISLRSIGDIPVNSIAKEYFEGGGHKNAAGGVSYLSLEETVAKFEEIIKTKYKKY